MTETTNARLDFGVKIAALIKSATSFNVIGTATVKTSKVLALGAVLTGAATEDVSKRTGIAEGTLKRIAAIARNGIPATADRAKVTAATISERLHALDWTSLTTEDAPADDVLNATYAAAAIWDDLFIEVSKGASRTREEMTPTSLAILIHDTIVKSDNPDVWIAAVNDALASAEAALTGDDVEEEDAA